MACLIPTNRHRFQRVPLKGTDMKIPFFQTTFSELSGFQALLQCLEHGTTPVSVTGLSQIHKAQLLAALPPHGTPLVLTEDDASALRLAADLNGMTGEETACVLPAREFSLTGAEVQSREYEQLRLSAFSKLCSGTCRMLIASAEAAMQRTIPPDVLTAHTLTLEQGEDYDLGVLTALLAEAGYTRCQQVEGPAQFAKRGSILDLFPIQEKQPVRLEFWDDTLDTISYFDPQSQRRTESLSQLTIPPALESLAQPEQLADAIEALARTLRGKHAADAKARLLADAEQLRGGALPAGIDKYQPLLYDPPATVLDYADGPVFLSEYSAVLEHMRAVLSRHMEDTRLLLEQGELCKGLSGYYLEPAQLFAKLETRTVVCLNTFLQGGDRMEYRRLISMEAVQTGLWGGELQQLKEDLAHHLRLGCRILVAAGTEKTTPALCEDLRAEGIPCDLAEHQPVCLPGRVLVAPGSFSSGAYYPENKTVLITRGKIEAPRKRLKKLRRRGEEIRALSEMNAGDLVVHAQYGIGRFVGIRKLELEGITKDFITIQYAGTDVLYVPVTQLDMVSRYIGPRDEGGVRLHKLSSTDWQKTRNSVRRAVQDMAKELTALYAKRAQTPGIAFLPDDEIQQDFEARFPYAETDDQLRSIQEIKQDMERPHPMDRLLCGDVGFGKTEVAFRAALKCVLSGKQCVILTPTTVLAWQHYQTALRRFEQFPVNIELLSRFRTPKQQKEVLEKLRKGTVDLVIGTHRLVQKDVQFYALGLAIIDEEQRFGVAHKERFKELFAGVDVLTLSATPIPRTLNMAMSGIRDMSVIEEPPQDRYPVQSYVAEYQEGLIQQALMRELRRGGQIYYLHNRTETIASCAAKLQQMVPEARIAYAHGKMTEEAMSDIWRQLVDYEIDILVCTTIIETGVDVPNVNTIIIEHADRLGLSQLYQLRGRVGRSNRRAYAYFTYQRGKVLDEVAAKRLAAMREFTQFGSGFRIALRDLEIRGAGSILGGRQHGHMEAVGYDMYLKMLGEAIAEERGEPMPKSAECTVDLQMDAHIPDSYIASLPQRLEVYRRIAMVSDQESYLDMIDELIDRFGEPPSSVMGLVDTALLRNTAARLGITEITQRRGSMLFYIQQPSQEQITALSSRYHGRVTFNCLDKPYIGVRLVKGDTSLSLMRQVLTVMDGKETAS